LTDAALCQDAWGSKHIHLRGLEDYLSDPAPNALADRSRARPPIWGVFDDCGLIQWRDIGRKIDAPDDAQTSDDNINRSIESNMRGTCARIC